MMTIAEAAARASVSEKLVRRWVSAGMLAHFRMGAKGSRGRIKIAPEDLDVLIASFKVGVKEERPRPERRKPPPKLKHISLN